MKKQLKFIIIFILFFSVLTAIVLFSGKDKKLEVVFIDVGQGDAILIRTPNNQDILIDGGPDNSTVDKIGRLLPFYDRDIELMVLTHAHSDHVSGLVPILKRYQVDQIFYSGKVINDAPDYLTWFKLVEEKSIPFQVVTGGEKINLGENLMLEVLYPFEDFTGKSLDDLNDTSVVIRLVYQETEFLFMGDASAVVEKKLIDKDLNLVSDVLKVGHHGSKNSTSPEFINAVSPNYAVISSGKDNKFGHPHFKTLNTLAKEKVKILRTDLCGEVIFKTNGVNLEINSQKCDGKL